MKSAKTSTPLPSSDQVRRSMSSQRTADTQPEVALRSALHRRGVRFRVHRRDLPGRPDIVLVRTRIAVFVDGCFWHQCPDHFIAPKANAEWWANKMEANTTRDRRNDERLRLLGWEPVHVWEHEDPEAAADALAARWFAH